MKSRKNIWIVLIISGLLLFSVKGLSLVTGAEPNVCDGSSMNTISEDIIQTGVNIEVNLTYNSCYIFGNDASFNLKITPNQLFGYIVARYIQVIYQIGTSNASQFIYHLGNVATVGTPVNLNIELRNLIETGENATAKVWFRFGYSLNGTDFGQIESSDKTSFTVSMINTSEEPDNDDGKIYLLWFALEPYQFAIVVGVIAILVILLVRRSKKKEAIKKERLKT